MTQPGDTILKESGSSIFHQFDWTKWLQEIDTTATIAGSTWTITGGDGDGGLTSDNPTIVTGSLKSQVRLIGGTKGKTYKVTNTITTNESPVQIEPQYIYIQIKP